MAIKVSDDGPRERRLFLIHDWLNCFQHGLGVILVLGVYGWDGLWAAGLGLLMLAYYGLRHVWSLVHRAEPAEKFPQQHTRRETITTPMTAPRRICGRPYWRT